MALEPAHRPQKNDKNIIFASYVKEDAAIAEELKSLIESHSHNRFNVFIADTSIHGGDMFRALIEKKSD